jgi:hypothetical protein
MKKIIIPIIFFLYGMLSAQIDLKINFSNQKNSTIIITLINKTNDYYLVPFDKKGFKAYNSDEVCSNLNNLEYSYSFFAPTLTFKNVDNDSIVEPLMGNFHINRLSEKNINRLKKAELKEKAKIFNWKEKNSFSNDEEAIRNLYLHENLISLAPKEELKIKIEMDIYNIKRGNTYFYNYYTLTNNKTYNLSINLCADENIYNYLTKKQKKHFRKYKFYSGKLVSNTLSYIYKN